MAKVPTARGRISWRASRRNRRLISFFHCLRAEASAASFPDEGGFSFAISEMQPIYSYKVESNSSTIVMDFAGASWRLVALFDIRLVAKIAENEHADGRCTDDPFSRMNLAHPKGHTVAHSGGTVTSCSQAHRKTGTFDLFQTAWRSGR